MSVVSEPLYTGLPPFVHRGFEHVECISVVFLRKNSENHTKAAWIRTNLYVSAPSGLSVCSVRTVPLHNPNCSFASCELLLNLVVGLLM